MGYASKGGEQFYLKEKVLAAPFFAPPRADGSREGNFEFVLSSKLLFLSAIVSADKGDKVRLYFKFSSKLIYCATDLEFRLDQSQLVDGAVLW